MAPPLPATACHHVLPIYARILASALLTPSSVAQGLSRSASCLLVLPLQVVVGRAFKIQRLLKKLKREQVKHALVRPVVIRGPHQDNGKLKQQRTKGLLENPVPRRSPHQVNGNFLLELVAALPRNVASARRRRRIRARKMEHRLRSRLKNGRVGGEHGQVSPNVFGRRR